MLLQTYIQNKASLLQKRTRSPEEKKENMLVPALGQEETLLSASSEFGMSQYSVFCPTRRLRNRCCQFVVAACDIAMRLGMSSLKCENEVWSLRSSQICSSVTWMFLKENILPRCFPRIPVPSWTHPHDPVRCAKCCNDCVVLLTVVYAGKLCYVRNRCEKVVDNERKN